MQTELDRKLQEPSVPANQLDEESLTTKAEALLLELWDKVLSDHDKRMSKWMDLWMVPIGQTKVESQWTTVSFFEEPVELLGGVVALFNQPRFSYVATTSHKVNSVLAYIREFAPVVKATAVDANHVPIETTGPDRPVPECIFILECPPRLELPKGCFTRSH